MPKFQVSSHSYCHAVFGAYTVLAQPPPKFIFSITKNSLFVVLWPPTDLLVNAMDDSGMTRFLVDGFPRKLDQLHEFEQRVGLVLSSLKQIRVCASVRRGMPHFEV